MADQADADQAPLVYTIPPFSNTAVLPACAQGCTPLWDANGRCVPPAISSTATSVYTECFCVGGAVASFSTTTSGICDTACNADGLSSIGAWFRSVCVTDGTGDDGTDSEPTATATSVPDSGNNGDWISNHWQWVIFLAVMVVAIAGIWVGACIWRRRYVKKKNAQTTYNQKQSGSASRPSWGPGAAEEQMGTRPPLQSNPPSDDPRAAGVFMPGAQEAALEEKSETKPKKHFWSTKTTSK